MKAMKLALGGVGSKREKQQQQQRQQQQQQQAQAEQRGLLSHHTRQEERTLLPSHSSRPASGQHTEGIEPCTTLEGDSNHPSAGEKEEVVTKLREDREGPKGSGGPSPSATAGFPPGPPPIPLELTVVSDLTFSMDGGRGGERESEEGTRCASSDEEPYFTFSPSPSPPACYGKGGEGGRERGREGRRDGGRGMEKRGCKVVHSVWSGLRP